MPYQFDLRCIYRSKHVMWIIQFWIRSLELLVSLFTFSNFENLGPSFNPLAVPRPFSGWWTEEKVHNLDKTAVFHPCFFSGGRSSCSVLGMQWLIVEYDLQIFREKWKAQRCQEKHEFSIAVLESSDGQTFLEGDLFLASTSSLCPLSKSAYYTQLLLLVHGSTWRQSRGQNVKFF